MMGRLSKNQTDQVAKLRKEGYLQKEIGQKLGINIRTVRKYDPTAKSKQRKNQLVKEGLLTIKQLMLIRKLTPEGDIYQE